MSYNIPRNTTPIDLLPNLEDLDKPYGSTASPYNPTTLGGLGLSGGSSYATNMTYGSSMIPSEQKEKIERFIRQSHQPHTQSGMIVQHGNQEPQQIRTTQLIDEMYDEKSLNHNIPNGHLGVPNQESGPKTYAMPDNSPTCLNVAEHIANCPVCSKFYDNDKTIYIIAIVVLAIICILLLKRVLNV
jgi:hypothetical protein